ncbi:hypothetical protein RHGRI_009838 [Rhododendron griersonianum]|uniref:Uncharacterized protein n=1 Tax=Rhododendron griersonianum TaxID=479676 RepID=A0AAV6KGD5_9ERIC|nr:hypothetical protein RHGRI_009838 [Rhododendron griersonianum]
MSDNYLSGAIPQCLASSSSDSLLLLNLSSNNFHGTVPHMFMKVIRVIDLSKNQLHGVVPRSLVNCTMLEILLLEDNQIEDTFPYWLGTLPELKVLVLRSNKFHGAIEILQMNMKFQKLQIIDLSQNGFSGTLPSEFFQNLNAMKMVKKGNSTYMKVSKPVFTSSYGGNMGLCGVPLTMLCGNSKTSTPPSLAHSSQGDDDPEVSRGIYWMIIIMGNGSGLIVGLVIGHALTTRDAYNI